MAKVGNENFDIAYYLNQELENRMRKHGNYSLRRFAASLDLPVSTLSMLMSGKSYPKGITIKAIARELKWDLNRIEEVTLARDKKLVSKRQKINARKRLDPDFDLLENLIPLAVLAVGNTCQVDGSVENISAVLNISHAAAAKALSILERRKLVKIEGGLLKSTELVSAVVDDPGSQLVKSYVSQWLKLGAYQFENQLPQKTNSMLFHAFATEKDLNRIKAKFENFLRTIRTSFPVQRSAGDLYCIGAVIFPFKKLTGIK